MSTAPSLPPDFEPERDREQAPPLPPRRTLWKRLLLWSGLALLSLLVLLVLGVAYVLKSDRAHEYILRTAQQKATEALGSQVKVGNYSLTFSGISPTLDLYDVSIAGASPYADPPLLQVERLHTGVRIVSLLQKKWYLSEVVVNHPVVHVFVDKQGRDNLPKTKTSGQKEESATNLFDLGIRHAVLDRGEVYYNNRKSVLDADLHNVNFRSSFDAAQPRYYGTLAYSNGHLTMENFHTIPHDFRTEFEYSPNRAVLRHAVLRSGGSHFAVNATLDDFTSPKVQAEYTALVDAGEFRHILKNPTVPVGTIDLKGSVQYTAAPNRPLLNLVVLNGSLASRVLSVKTPNFQGDIRNLAANYSLRDGDAAVRNLCANVLGGTLNGNLTMRNVSSTSRSHATAKLSGVSLVELKKMVSAPQLRKVGLAGSVNADVDATWGKTIDNLVARANASVAAKVAPASSAQSVPVNSEIHARYSAASETVTLANSFVRTPQTNLSLDGTVGKRAGLNVNLRANELHELESIAAMFQSNPQPLDIFGNATFQGTVTGSTSAPRIRGQLVGSNLRVKGSSWRLLRTNIDASPSQASLSNGELVPLPRGRITFDLRAGLKDWGFSQNSPFDVKLNGNQLNIAQLAKTAGVQAPVTGILNVNVNARGTQLNPVGNGRIELSDAKVAGENIQVARVQFEGTGDQVRANLLLRLPAGAATGNVNFFPKQQGYDLNLQANGIRLDQLQTVKARNMQLTGVLNVNASGRGTIKDPQLAADVNIPKLTVQDQTIEGISLNTQVANHVANAALNSRMINTTLQGRAKINLTGDYYTEATLDTQPIPLQPLVAAYAPEQASNITGQTEIHGTLKGPLKKTSAVEAHITIPSLAVNYRNAVQVGAPQPIRMDYVNGVLNLQRSAIQGTGTDLQFQGTIPVVDRSAPMSLLLLGTIDLRLAQILNPDLASSGQLRFDINSYGQRTDPNIQGQIRIENAAFATSDAPLGLTKGNGVLTLTRNRLEVTRFEGTVGGGKVAARGGIAYRPAIGFDLAMSADSIRLLYPEGVRSGIGGNITMTGTPEAAYLRGQVNLDQLSFMPGFDLMDTMGEFGSTTSAPPTQGFTNNLQLDIAIRTPQGINVSSRELSLQGTANLNVKGTAADPVILGRMNLNNGDLIFRGNRYLLEGATVDFVNPTRTEPVINAAVNTTIDQYNISMRFQGPADQMRTSYNSDPALPPADIINLLAFGETTEASAANPNPPGNLGAQSAIASAVAGQVTGRLAKVAGISHLSVDPTLGGTGSSGSKNAGATITVQQRVTSKIFVTFSTDATSTQRQVMQLEYQVNPRFAVSGTRDQNGGMAFDTKFRKRW